MEKIKLILGLVIYKLAPIKKNRYVFTSFNGHYSDNTKYISIKLHEIDNSAEIVWLVRPEYEKDVPDYAKKVIINSLKSYWYRGTAMAQIDNVYGFRAIFKFRDDFISNLWIKIYAFLSYKRKQPIFATMHSTACKKIGRDQVGNTVLDMSCLNSYLMVGDQLTADVYDRVTFGKMITGVFGWPRNDILFEENPGMRNKLGLPNDKKILLYAPTFRNDGPDVEGKNVYRSGISQLEGMNMERLFQTLAKKFDGDWVMVCRFHYHVAEMVDWAKLEEQYPGRFINGNNGDDMAEYLVCSDILVTDASSCMYDFSITKKPCFLYFPDLENYLNKERGLYVEIDELPYSIATDFSDFLDNIMMHDQIKYEKQVESFMKKIGSQCDGNAAERMVNFIRRECKYRRGK